MGFPWQEYWSGLPFPSPGDLPSSGIKPKSPTVAGRFLTAEPPGKPMSSSLIDELYLGHRFGDCYRLKCVPTRFKLRPNMMVAQDKAFGR